MSKVYSKTRESSLGQSSTILDKVINELSSKLVSLSGKDCEIEVDVQIRFPEKPEKSHRGTKAATKGSRQPVKCRPKKSQSQHKMHDFVFDIESYAKADPRDATPASNELPLANAVERRASPDIVTLGGMCNVDSSDDVGGKKAQPSSSASSNASTSQLFPKAHVHFHK